MHFPTMHYPLLHFVTVIILSSVYDRPLNVESLDFNNWAKAQMSWKNEYSSSVWKFRPWREQYIIRELLKTYDIKTRPQVSKNPTIDSTFGPDRGEPVVVHTALMLQTINSVDEINMASEFKARFRFEQRWTDERLNFHRFNDENGKKIENVHLAYDQVIWKPDTFFQNEKSGTFHVVDQPNCFVKIFPDGKVLYNVRIGMTFSCVMNLHNYPMDTQECVIDFANGYTTEDIIYVWEKTPIHVDPQVTSVLPNMAIKAITNGTCTSKTNTGEYSCLRISLIFERQFSFFLLQLYIPSSLLVVVSCLSYWIDWRASAGRMLLTIVTLLTLITQNYSVSANLPPVSYATAIDVWIGACVVFVFTSLVEYAFVNYIGLIQQQKIIASSYPFQRLPNVQQDVFENLCQQSTAGEHHLSSSFHDEKYDKRQLSTSRTQAADEFNNTESLIINNPEFSADEPCWCAMSQRAQRRLYHQLHLPSLEPDFYFLWNDRAEKIDSIFRYLIPICFFFFNICLLYSGDASKDEKSVFSLTLKLHQFRMV
ncbi:Glutamate-gated chloride channel [Trichinella zimbabwensis]|uniref:Glutamate-gated chloride channel n=1 Tax=Trichinella zimbabwensis TaxID=268475 RepID=A0A0V1HL53_9BILA|nr:Glutamate-gated chloride channel [Trichinella zimbabwensis]